MRIVIRHPLTGKQIKRARYVMEMFLGRELLSDEIIHHKNEDKTDDRVENLEIVTRKIHQNIHCIGRVCPEEKKQKIRESVKRDRAENGHPWTGLKHSEESKQKMSAVQKKRYAERPMTEEHRQKLCTARRKRIISEETKAKTSASSKAAWERRKAVAELNFERKPPVLKELQ